jgi:hypothetical protein
VPPVAYTVRAELPDAETAERWIAWLVGTHAGEVVACGAESAEVLRLDPEPGEQPPRFRAEARYRFASREALADYLANHAPRLREEGLRAFPPASGVRLSRTVGELLEPSRHPSA